MTKKEADEKVLQYKDKIFGFALSKTSDYEQAEELSSQIICEVYISLLKTDEIINMDGYVYRLASNVFAKFVHGLVEGRKVSNIDTGVPESSLASEDSDFYEDNKAELELLKKEIGYLSERQRTIVYLHYYENMTVTTIAKALNISANTVKWHLSDARTTLKEVMIMNYENEKIDTTLAVNPIFFQDMGHCGTPGENMADTKTMFDSRLKQNIAWACYWEPKTLVEIARNVGVPIAYIRDELQKLVDFGYIDQVDESKNPKFQTNMVIFNDTLNKSEKQKYSCDEEYKEAAKIVCEKYFPQIFADFEADPEHWGMSCADNDVNYLKYNLIIATLNFLKYSDSWQEIEKLKVKRPDGGNFVAIASVCDDCTEDKNYKDPNWVCGYMMNGCQELDYYSLQIQCKHTSRSDNWRDNLFGDECAKFINNNCNPDSLKLEEYEKLCKSGMIKNNVVQCAIIHGKDSSIWDQVKDKMAKYESVIKALEADCKRIDDKIQAKMLPAFPKKAQAFIKYGTTNTLGSERIIPYIIDEMLERGMLKELTPDQKKTVLYILSVA